MAATPLFITYPCLAIFMPAYLIWRRCSVLRQQQARHQYVSEACGSVMCSRASFQVEMAGIEPASKKFGQRYTTSLVTVWFSQSGTPATGCSAASRCFFVSAYRHRADAIRFCRRLLPSSRIKYVADVADAVSQWLV